MAYYAKSNIKHDDMLYEAGDLLDLPESAIKRLMEAGVVEEREEKAEKPSKKVAPDEKNQDEEVEKAIDGEGKTATSGVEEKPNMKWSKDRLLAFAEENGIKGVNEEMKRNEILAKING